MPRVLRSAFVAMRFDSEPWNDRRYNVVKDVLEEAGYGALRGDEIRTSGNVADEVCRRLTESDLVVIDTTGDSHNVSYELGFCHGVKRDPNTTLLLRQAGVAAPFNYQHYRQLQYRDLRHLRRLLRAWLYVSIPLTPDQLGYSLNVHLAPEHPPVYGSVVADAVLAALNEMDFTGRCEYYAHDGWMVGMPDSYIVCLGLRPASRRKKLDYSWWTRMVGHVARALEESGTGLTLNLECSEFNEMRAIRHWSMIRGVAEFEDGLPSRLLGIEDPDSWFAVEITQMLTSAEKRESETVTSE